MSEKVSRNKIMRQQDFIDVATRLVSWQKGLFPISVRDIIYIYIFCPFDGFQIKNYKHRKSHCGGPVRLPSWNV